jgi:hypothetical protein
MAGLAMLTFGVALALVTPRAPSNVEPPRKPIRLASNASSSSAGRSRLDELRDEAASGSEFANLALSTALLDRYDQTGDRDDLYEAIVWIDRQWETSGRAELTARVVAQYCTQRVVRWHRICDLGE